MFEKINEEIANTINLESALIGSGINSYVWYRSRFFLTTTVFYYFSFYLRLYYLGDEYTNFYLSQMALYEQAIFWIAQFVWLFILSADNLKEEGISKDSAINTKAFLYLSVGFSVLMSAILYLNGLLVLNRWSVYGCVSFIFVIQTLINIYIKAVHAKVYKNRRVFVYVPLIILINVASAFLQIILWRRYSFWSIPVVFGLQYFLLTSVRCYFYFKAYREVPDKLREPKDSRKTFKLLFSWHSIFALILLLHEMVYFSAVKFYFFKNSSYETFIFFIAVLVNSRYPFIFFQDFIKYSQKKYDAVLFSFLRRIFVKNLVFTTLVFLAFLGFNFLVSGHIPFKLTMESVGLGLIFSTCNLINMYFFSRRAVFGIALNSISTTILVLVSLYLFQKYYFVSALAVQAVVGIFYLFILKKTYLILNCRRHSITYDKETFCYNILRQKTTRLIHLQLDHVTYNHEILAQFLNKHAALNSLFFLESKKSIWISFNKLQIPPEILFLVLKIDELSVDEFTRNFSSKRYLMTDLDFKADLMEASQFQNKGLTHSDVKVYFNKVFKQHSVNAKSIFCNPQLHQTISVVKESQQGTIKNVFFRRRT